MGFYCLGAMDILGRLSEDTKEKDREGWREWIWSRQVIPSYVIVLDGMYSLPSLTEIDVRNESEIGGFKPGTFMDVGGVEKEVSSWCIIVFSTPNFLISIVRNIKGIGQLPKSRYDIHRSALIGDTPR